jgi:hypothetical protein
VAGGLGDVTNYTQSLAFGMGYEGPIKYDMARTMAEQATPEYATSVERSLDRAVARVASSPSIRVVLGLPDPGKDGRAYIRPVGVGMSAPVTVVLKDGGRIMGEKLSETKEWITVTTKEGKERVRPSEVMRIIESKPSGVRPATED